jgi:class 3 adenylate cyclase
MTVCPTCGHGTERKLVSVLFADPVGFTAQAERLDPEDVQAIPRARTTSASATSSSGRRHG